MSALSQNRGQGVLTLLRTIVETCAIIFITAAILDFGVTSTYIGNYLISLQLIPAALTLSAAVIALWIAVTLIFGRIYCSTICPLGTLMDLAQQTKPRRQFHFAPPLDWIRSFSAGMLILNYISAYLPAEWFEPYGIYRQIVSHIAAPRLSLATAIALALFAAIFVIARRRGRLICNTICPAGTLLSIFSRHSALRIDINTDRCIQCRKCEHACKSQCIDMESHTVDMSRCVVCFNCLPDCPNDAISYTLSRHTLSIPMMQSLNPSTSLQAPICDNTSTCSKTSSTTELSKPTAPEPEP